MSDLISWLRQQLDTDEQKALLAKAEIEAASKTWQGFADDIWKRALIDADGIADHLEANDPDRALRQVQAHRAILNRHGFETTESEGSPPFRYCLTCGSGEPHEYPTQWPCATLLDSVSIYSDRDGYKEEWSA